MSTRRLSNQRLRLPSKPRNYQNRLMQRDQPIIRRRPQLRVAVAVARNLRNKHAVYDQRCQTRFQCDGRMGLSLSFCNEQRLKNWRLPPGRIRAVTRATLCFRGICYKLSSSKSERMKQRSRLRRSKKRTNLVNLESMRLDLNKCAGKKINWLNMRQKTNRR